MPSAGTMSTGSGRLGFVVRRVLVGPALRSAAVAEERMRKLVALPVLSSDALSSVAYLAVVAAAVFVAFDGRTDALIPLYAVGVFLAFTLAQSGMVVHWRRHRERHWRKAALTNAIGALLSPSCSRSPQSRSSPTEPGWSS
jgi:hypothetical protein